MPNTDLAGDTEVTSPLIWAFGLGNHQGKEETMSPNETLEFSLLLKF